MQEAEAIHFRKCSSSDITLLQKISIQSYNEHYTHLWDDQGEAYLERTYNQTVFESDFNNPHCHYYLIYQETEPAGFFKLRESVLAPFAPADCLELNKIYILNSFTGKRLGSLALQFITKLALAMNRNILWLNVMDKSAAKHFYERNGFEFVKETSLTYPYIKQGLNVLSTYKKQITKF